MKPTGKEMEARGPGYEATLHLVTHAPVPEGLEKRVNASLATTPRRGRMLEWPIAGAWVSGWMRAAAAAAIVVVVAGGGWGVFRHAQQHPPTKVVAMPAPQVTAPAAGGFSSAGAVRTPQTVKGPAVVETPVVETPKAKAKIAKKPAGKRRVVKAASVDQPAVAGAAK
jgi:hypothetical protein